MVCPPLFLYRVHRACAQYPGAKTSGAWRGNRGVIVRTRQWPLPEQLPCCRCNIHRLGMIVATGAICRQGGERSPSRNRAPGLTCRLTCLPLVSVCCEDHGCISIIWSDPVASGEDSTVLQCLRSSFVRSAARWRSGHTREPGRHTHTSRFRGSMPAGSVRQRKTSEYADVSALPARQWSGPLKRSPP
ncbi:hypothetical protein GGR38_004685 [Novosphingobium sediminicola]|uniref:Uncharacterized protein n=1 Tax=Novosphingobium sediminicola TaxID=563162 RepID=A0A7W6CPU4_9SPHN|nr:hypothetical protein [Novosphingobium sediminicola]